MSFPALQFHDKPENYQRETCPVPQLILSLSASQLSAIDMIFKIEENQSIASQFYLNNRG